MAPRRAALHEGRAARSGLHTICRGGDSRDPLLWIPHVEHVGQVRIAGERHGGQNALVAAHDEPQELPCSSAIASHPVAGAHRESVRQGSARQSLRPGPSLERCRD